MWYVFIDVRKINVQMILHNNRDPQLKWFTCLSGLSRSLVSIFDKCNFVHSWLRNVSVSFKTFRRAIYSNKLRFKVYLYSQVVFWIQATWVDFSMTIFAHLRALNVSVNFEKIKSFDLDYMCVMPL